MPPDQARRIQTTFRDLGLQVLERGWLSSNNIVFAATAQAPATVVDTGYVGHSDQTLALVRAALGSTSPQRVVNTHLHSDHCGGNAVLQQAHECEVWVPAVSFDAVQAWDQDRLTYRATGQRCAPFSAQVAIRPDDSLRLGCCDWEAIAAPGHDPDALMFFQRESGVLISADALWEDRLAIVFPELAGLPGFGDAGAVLDLIERLQPTIVIPGHGRPFVDVGAAVAHSRRRIDGFLKEPRRHLRYAERALTMFHMMEVGHCERQELISWLAGAEVFRVALKTSGGSLDAQQRAQEVVQRLVDEHLLALREGSWLSVA